MKKKRTDPILSHNADEDTSKLAREQIPNEQKILFFRRH